MSDFIIAVGHTASGNVGCGVVARLDESKCTRAIGVLVAEYLQEKGHGVNLLRVDESNTYNCQDCYERANKANEIAKTSEVEVYLEIHINAGGGTGPEICVTGKSDVANQYAVKISNALASALDLPNRGVKTRSLIVLNRTVMPAILIECLFADSDDADKYNAEVIARAIVCGLVGEDDSGDVELKLGWNRDDIGWWYCTNVQNRCYYTSKDGLQEINGEWYKFNDMGYAIKDTWYYDEKNNAWYYLDENWKMLKGTKDKTLWKWINGKCYAFGEDGKMYCDCVTPDGFSVDESGAWIR